LGNFTYWNFTTSPAPSPMHLHSDIMEIHCMIKGQRYSQIENLGSLKRYTYTGNEVFITFPFELHGNGNQPQLPCEFYALQIITKDPRHMLGLNEEYSAALYHTLLGLNRRHYKLGSSHLQYLRTAFNFFSDLSPSSIQIGVQFLTCFLFSLSFLSPIIDSTIKKIDEPIHNAITFLNQNICEELQIRNLAEVSGYSLSRFKVKFKNEVGITPSEYITLQKLEFAKKHLVETAITITDLAHMLSFSSSNYFSSVFKKYMDCTPKEYRLNYQQYETPKKPRVK
ncbi:MAG: AraC family transcriptional regulator, partial [Lachnospiraceae bacterium]|nr:AraC family transcriptional regulator [Lachnospiraceae bacterium]